MRTESLAGLGFEFAPVSLQLPDPGARERHDRADQGVRPSRPAGDSGVRRSAQHRSVSFNLAPRCRGPGYSSPIGALTDQRQQVVARAQATSDAALDGDVTSSAAAPATAPSGLHRLKLASLQRRSALPAGAASSVQTGTATSAAAGEASAHRELGTAAEPGAGGAQREVALNPGVETLLAGCSSQVLEQPPHSVLLPPHVLAGQPVLATPLNLREQEVEEQAFQIRAYHPEPVVGSATATAALRGCPFRGSAAAAAVSTSGDVEGMRAAVPSPERGMDPSVRQPEPPVDVQSALCCLRLLGGSSGAGEGEAEAACRCLWMRLRAVKVVLSAKQAAEAAADVLAMLHRLRHVRMHLAYHQANLRLGRSRSPGRDGSPAGVSPPSGPWLSGRSSASDSKHRRSRSGSPGMPPRPRVARPSRETSELQAQLLTSLQRKLLLKAGLCLLRQAAAASRLRARLLQQVSVLGAGDLCRRVLRGWHAAAVPSPGQHAAAAQLAKQLAGRHLHEHVAAWRGWAARRAWRSRQLARGTAALRQRLLAAGVQHWRCYCQLELVCRLQVALAARWLAAWGRRRALLAWRQTARRSAQLKAALLSGGSEAAAPRSPLPSQLEALAATAAAFVPVRAFVADATRELRRLRKGLRVFIAAPAAGGELAERQPGPPLPLGSVEALLQLVPPPRPPAEQQPHQHQRFSNAQHLHLQLLGGLQQGGDPAASPGLAAAASPRSACESPRPDGVSCPAAPAPDPGSPAYNPASYASPARAVDARQQPARPPSPRGRGQPAASSASTAAAVAELLECQSEVERLGLQLADLEQESEQLQRELAVLEGAREAAQQAAASKPEACAAAAAAQEAAAAAMHAAAQHQADAAAACGAQQRLVQQRQQEVQEAAAAAAGARAAVNAAAEVRAMASAGVQRWSKSVEGVARELAACHRTQQPPVMARLREARQRLEQHQLEAAAAEQQLPGLRAAVEQADRCAQHAQQALLHAQAGLVAAAERSTRAKSQLDVSMARHEAAAVAAVAASQEASAAEDQQRLLAAQQAAAAGRLRQAAQRVMRKQMKAGQLQELVQRLQSWHQAAAAAVPAGAAPPRRPKRRLQAAQEAGRVGAAMPSPTAVQQRRPPPTVDGLAAGTASLLADGAPANCTAFGPCLTGTTPATQAAAVCPASPWEVAVVHSVPQPSSRSSDMGAPASAGEPAPPPLTVDAAAACFHSRVLLRRGLAVLRAEASATGEALCAVAEAWRRRHLVAAFRAWRSHAIPAAAKEAAAAVALRRRWLLRRWLAAAVQQSWQREADAAADSFARRRMLSLGVAAWRQHVQHECWRDAVHEGAALLRLRNELRFWRVWTRRRRQKAARLRTALALYQSGLLAAAFRQWRRVQRGKALLHRVFSTAAELWRDEVGARLHQRNYECVAACWRAWQLAVLQAQEERRQGMLEFAAIALRERQLKAAGLAAFQHAAAEAREQERLVRLAAHMLAHWRSLAACSARHWRYEAARQQRKDRLLLVALAAWQAATEATAEQLARFWPRWQVQGPLRLLLQRWQAAAAALKRRRVLASAAEVHREMRIQQHALSALAANAQGSRSASSGGAGTQQQASCRNQWQQQPVKRAESSRNEHMATSTTTIVIQRSFDPPEQQQEQVASNRSDAGDWRAAADYWRQRHQCYSHQRQPGGAASAGWQAVQVHVHPLTAATLAELQQRA